MTVILAIANHNGGVGKTVTAANIAAGFARAGRRTLAVDCDARAHLTRWLLGHADEDAADLEAIVAGADPATTAQPTRVAELDALPATPRLARIGRALAADATLIAGGAAYSSGRLLLIRKRSATRNLTQGSPGREQTRRQAPELLRPAKA